DLAGAAATAVVAGLVAGPLLPLDVATGTRQHLLDWSARLGFFLGIGLVMGAIIVRLKGSLEREIALAREDRDLALRESEATLRAVFAASPDMITMVEADGELGPPSPAVRDILGYEPGEYAQMDRMSLIHPDDRERVNKTLRSLLQGGPPVELRFRVPHADGHWVVLESHARGMTDAEGRPIGLVAVSRDVTKKVALEEALTSAKKEAERAREDAERANRAKSDFLSRMSHELRTPLNAILGFGQLLEMDGLEPQHQESVEQILKGGKHLLDLINEVLDIARIESGRITLSLEPVVLADALSEAIGLIQPLAAEQGIELKAEDARSADRYVRADRQRVKQVLLNLLSNAVKYNRSGGRVIVRCLEVQGDRLRVEVSDQGTGIAPEMMDRLFVPFERLEAEGTGVEGTGLGLALSKGLVEAMGGSLGVTSIPGQGSTFFVELPLAEAPGIMDEGKEAAKRPFLQAPVGAHALLY
ncbi:MAG: PAS domain-containing sensor histidine kinase, partial [Candidatus Methylomirabilales bacterium]